MKRVLAISFLFVFLIAYTPITSVHATEVNWGDNNNYYLTDEEFYTARQLATLEIIPQLTGNGVNELSINNAESVDDWIINFLEYIDDNAESAVSNIYSTCVDIKNEIDTNANRIGQELKSFGTDLDNAFGTISDWFDTIIGVKSTYLSSPYYIRSINNLSRITSSSTPNPDPNLAFVSNCASYIARWNLLGDIDLSSVPYYMETKDARDRNYCSRRLPYSIFSVEDILTTNELNRHLYFYDVGTVNLTTNQDNSISAQYIFSNKTCFHNDYYNLDFSSASYFRYNTGGYIIMYTPNLQSTIYPFQTEFNGISTACNYLYQHFRHINIYVDGQPWALVSDNQVNNISLDINGIDMYSDTNKEPIQYYFPQGTQIDYKKLYLVIKQAIEDSLPISQTTINQGDVYYDNSNNVYAPVIYNYYSDDESESDVISDVLTLAVIPKFDTALLEPIEEPITNGTTIMITGVQALPSDLLFVIGAGFVLILFGAFINRLIE